MHPTRLTRRRDSASFWLHRAAPCCSRLRRLCVFVTWSERGRSATLRVRIMQPMFESPPNPPRGEDVLPLALHCPVPLRITGSRLRRPVARRSFVRSKVAYQEACAHHIALEARVEVPRPATLSAHRPPHRLITPRRLPDVGDAKSLQPVAVRLRGPRGAGHVCLRPPGGSPLLASARSRPAAGANRASAAHGRARLPGRGPVCVRQPER